MRALLIANPKATTTSRRAREILLHALAGDLRIELAATERRGHATELAARAAREGHDLVITLGGDGTINEAVNGLLTDGPSPSLPALAVIPGGSNNVFPRALGLPTDPLRATSMVLDALRAGRWRSVGLGTADGRYFTFCAGYGFDAEVIHAVERARSAGARASTGLYVREALREFFTRTDRKHPAITLERPGHDPQSGLFIGIVSNSSPWTYLSRWPVDLNPMASFDSGLDLCTVRRLDTASTLRVLAQAILPLPQSARGRHVLTAHDMAEFTLRSSRPMAFQLDGDYLGERESVTFRSVPKAIRIVI